MSNVTDDPETAIGKLKGELAEAEAGIAAAIAETEDERLPTNVEIGERQMGLAPPGPESDSRHAANADAFQP